MSKAPEVALLVGAGDAIGAAVARRFAKGGYIVCIARRDGEKFQAHHFSATATAIAVVIVALLGSLYAS